MHSRIKIIFFISVIALFGCSDGNKSSNTVVKVGESVLTEENIASSLGEFQNQNKFREEFINDWIEKEVLFLEARDEGILESDEYLQILEKSKKELAAALLIKNYIEANKYEPNADELKNFYEKYKQDFTFTEDNYKINRIYFKNIESAVRFRKLLIESDWKKAVNSFRGDESLILEEAALLIPAHKLETFTQFRVVSNLLPSEVSIIIQEEPSKFVIVQLIEKFDKGSIPTYEMITDLVKERFMILKNKELIREYLSKLIDDHNIDIKRYTE